MKLLDKKSLLAILAAVMLVVNACSDSETTDTVPDYGFDKTALLTNYADNLIIPGYITLEQKLETLESAVGAFLANPTPEEQQRLKLIYQEAYLQMQRVAVYQIGPAETQLLNNFLNTFPADAPKIESNISTLNYSLETNSATTQQGFPALDYLLFSEQAVPKLQETAEVNRKKYVLELLARMKTRVNAVKTNWQNTYRAAFIANTRTDVGSPLGFLVNQLAYQLDQLKGPRIGWPYGKQSGGALFPEKSEAYYAGIAGALAVENLTSLKLAYTGGNSGKGISDYLVALKKESLNADVLQQFEVTLNKLKAIPDPLPTSLTTHPDLIDAAYREVQNLLTLMKTDVASATGVRITYQDSDGD